ncbi:MAG: hypothetical protein II885_13490 [Oscillospiraceae bacterium]|nr:hypothetical protein [Oscillospiraceae bacterium]
MKRTLALLLSLCLIAGLCGCGKKKKAEPEQTAPPAPTPTPNEVFEVKLTLDNLYTYFDYKEYRADVRDENTSEIDSSTIAYGLQLKPQFTAAKDPAHKDTMALRFEAEGVVMSGDFQINFDDLSFTGTPVTSERVQVSEMLHFWPKGDRTTTWAFGNYSNSNIMFFDRFTVTQVTGTVYLKMADLAAAPEPSFIPAFMREGESDSAA